MHEYICWYILFCKLESISCIHILYMMLPPVHHQFLCVFHHNFPSTASMQHLPFYMPMGQPMIVNGQLVSGFAQGQLQSSPPPQFTPQSPSQAPFTPEAPKKKKPFKASLNEGPKLVYNNEFKCGTLQLNVSTYSVPHSSHHLF